jgi:hypothetical protein
VPTCARPFPVLGLGDQPAAHGIGVQVFDHRSQGRGPFDLGDDDRARFRAFPVWANGYLNPLT